LHTEQQVLDRLRSDATYVRDFVEAYGPRNPTAITGRRFGHAIASFESTVISFDAPMDRRQQGNLVLSPMAEIGYGLFIKSHCMQCHVPPLFTDLRPHNNGMEFATKFFADDVGRIAITPDEPDSVRAFKTATLRQIADTYPYSHAGSLPTLAAVVRHYNSGGQRFDGTFDPFMDKRIKPLGLTDYQVKCLVTFLMEGFTAFDYPRFKPPRNLR
jgi:cytochrome c peroxidase